MMIGFFVGFVFNSLAFKTRNNSLFHYDFGYWGEKSLTITGKKIQDILAELVLFLKQHCSKLAWLTATRHRGDEVPGYQTRRAKDTGFYSYIRSSKFLFGNYTVWLTDMHTPTWSGFNKIFLLAAYPSSTRALGML